MLKCNLSILAFKMLLSKITLNHRVLDTLRLFSFSFWNAAYFTLILIYKEL